MDHRIFGKAKDDASPKEKTFYQLLLDEEKEDTVEYNMKEKTKFIEQNISNTDFTPTK